MRRNSWQSVKKIGQETDFLVMDETGLALPEAMLAQQLESLW